MLQTNPDTHLVLKLRQTLDYIPTPEQMLSLQSCYRNLSAEEWVLELTSNLELSKEQVYHCQGLLIISKEQTLKHFKIHKILYKNGKNSRIQDKLRLHIMSSLGLKPGNKGYSLKLLTNQTMLKYKQYCCKDYTGSSYISGTPEDMVKCNKEYHLIVESKKKIKYDLVKEKRKRRNIIRKAYMISSGKFNSIGDTVYKFNSITFINTLIENYYSTEITLSRNLINMHYDDILKLNKKDYTREIKKRICNTCEIDYPSHGTLKPELTKGMLSIQQTILHNDFTIDELDIEE
jgi:hypothetical protein